jgi:hypothetical protein
LGGDSRFDALLQYLLRQKVENRFSIAGVLAIVREMVCVTVSLLGHQGLVTFRAEAVVVKPRIDF